MSQAAIPFDPLVGVVTRPDHFDPKENYALVVARGDHPLGDYDIIDAQKILRYDLAAFGGMIVREGSIITEAGGTIGTAQPGVIIGGDALGAAGTFVGTNSQVYTIKVLTGGVGGEAMYTWVSSGMDNPNYADQPFPVKDVAPDVATGLANLAKYGCPIGVNGMQAVFVNASGRVHGASSWAVQATYGAQAPQVSGNTIRVSDLIIFIEGKIQRVKGETLTYPETSIGVSIVYGEWTRSLVTNTDDPTLTDPLSDEPQAYRERWLMVLRTSDTSTLAMPPGVLERRVMPLYRWDRATDDVSAVDPIPFRIPLEKTEGALPAARLVNVDQSETFRGLLAQRTFEPHGNFVVLPNGGNPRAYASTNTPSPNKLRVTIPPVLAYIEGVRFRSSDPQDIELDQAIDTGAVADEVHTFVTGTMLYLLNKANAGFPVSTITKCTAYVAVTAEPMVRGATQDDPLPKTPVVSLEVVKTTGTTYTPGTDYSLAGNNVRWVAGRGPASSTPYTVDYTYNKLMAPGVDYKLTGGNIDFGDPTGDLPKHNSPFQVDYQYFLWRTDGVMIRPTGEIAIVRGIPQDVKALPVLPMYALPYCLVTVAPGGGQVTITGYNNDSLTMEQLCEMRDENVRRKIDAARLELAHQATSLTTANLLDIITEAFSTTEVADMGYNVAGIAFDATIDTVAQELSLPYVQAVRALDPQVPGTTVRTGSAFFSIPYTDELALDAPRWSTDYPVNPYADFRPEPPLVRLTPDRDYWIDSITLTSTESRIVQNGRHEDWRIVGTFTTNQTQVRNIPFLHMRQIAVQVVGDHLVPRERVRLRIDGKDVAITAALGTQIDAFTIECTPGDSQSKGGEMDCTTAIPPLVPSGVTTFELWGDNAVPGAVWPGGYTIRATAQFSSNGTLRLITTQTVVNLVQNDPVAQSVIFPQPRMITKVVVPIAATPPHSYTSPPLLCEIRLTDRSGEASSPIIDVVGLVSKWAWEWAASGEAVFPDPIYMPANIYRSIVMRSASNLYRVYVSQLGGPDRVAGGFITQQQIDAGIFMDSSNNRDWTLRQDWDLRCQVYVAKLSTLEAYLYYQPVTVTGATALFLTVDQVVPDACGIEWSYTINAGVTWQPFDPFTLAEFTAVASVIQIRARLWSRDWYVTPVVQRFNAQLLVLSNKTSGRYISDSKQTLLNRTRIDGQVDLQLPVGATAEVWVSANNGVAWTKATLTPQGTAADGYAVNRFSATTLASSTPGLMRLRVDLGATDASRRPRVKRLYAYALP